MSDGSDQTKPFAYLNYIIFDKAMHVVPDGSKSVRVPLEGGYYTEELNLPENSPVRMNIAAPLSITANGYIYVWVSNESENTRVWFDDLSITQTQALVTQATDYGVWGDVLREQKSDESDYRFGYQGQFSERDLETGWSHFELREYDAVIGRWTATDPYRQFYSPYVGMGNEPAGSVDPDGGKICPTCPDGAEYDVYRNSNLEYSYSPSAGGDGVFQMLGGVTVTPDNPTPWQVGAEWLTGTGPRDRAFMDGDTFTEMLKQHEHIQEVKGKIANALATGSDLPKKPEDLNYALGGLEGVPKYISDYSTLATAGKTGNLAVTYLGSYTVQYTLTNVDVHNRTATVHFHVNNSSTIESATHPPIIGYTPWWSKNIGQPLNKFFSSGPLSKTTQTFDWTETIKWK